MQRRTDLQRVFLSRRVYDASELDGRSPPSLSFDQGLALHFGSENQISKLKNRLRKLQNELRKLRPRRHRLT
mgnify:CR=1 FL=1